MQDWKGKVAVVTGSGSGIGKAMAERFAQEGMRLALADIDEAALKQVASELELTGAAVTTKRVDVSKPEEVEALREHVFDRFGGVHLLCNNAGVLPPGAPVWREPLATWRWALGVNFYGVLHGIQAFVPHMLKAGDEAHIVNTASLAGLTTRPLMSAYNVSKHAVVALSECLFAELQLTTDRIHVSVLCPAFAKTRLAEVARYKPEGMDMDASQSFGFYEALKNVVEEGTPPEQIVDAVVEAVREKRFWILTHPELDSSIRSRFESILARTNPPLRDLRAKSTPLI